jgi:single-stranded-DNA-specific exonuclease
LTIFPFWINYWDIFWDNFWNGMMVCDNSIEAIEYAQSLGIDTIITDHHAVPEVIPENIPVVNPKRKDSQYPFPNLAGA